MARVLTALLTAGMLTLGAPCALAQHDHGAPEAAHDSHGMTSADSEMMRAMKLMQGAPLQRYYPLHDDARGEYEEWRKTNRPEG